MNDSGRRRPTRRRCVTGIREFNIGTAARACRPLRPLSARWTRSGITYGVLKLTLNTNDYSGSSCRSRDRRSPTPVRDVPRRSQHAQLTADRATGRPLHVPKARSRSTAARRVIRRTSSRSPTPGTSATARPGPASILRTPMPATHLHRDVDGGRQPRPRERPGNDDATVGNIAPTVNAGTADRSRWAPCLRSRRRSPIRIPTTTPGTTRFNEGDGTSESSPKSDQSRSRVVTPMGPRAATRFA